MSNLHKYSVRLSIFVALLLSACGGGSSSVNDDCGNNSTPATVSILASPTTTLDIPAKMIEEQHQEVVDSGTTKGAKVGFVSLGCRTLA